MARAILALSLALSGCGTPGPEGNRTFIFALGSNIRTDANSPPLAAAPVTPPLIKGRPNP